jgi:FAD/FMN-containing dehydrogenase
MTTDSSLSAFLSQAREALGDRAVLTDQAGFAPYANDWRQKFFGKPAAVVFASNTEQVVQLVRLANKHQVALVPQGGNTGLSGGATPDETGRQVILNLSRMTRIRARDQDNKTITVDAGVTMQTVQEEADKATCQRTRAARRCCAMAMHEPCAWASRWSPPMARFGMACVAFAKTTPATTCVTCS